MKADDGVRLTARRQPPQKTAAPAEEDDLLNIENGEKGYHIKSVKEAQPISC